MSSAPVITAKVSLECQNILGEGILWDAKEGLLHWVDIDEAQIHTYDPKTKEYGVDNYPETKYISAIALRRDQPGSAEAQFVALLQHEVALLPAPARPSSKSTKPTPTSRKSESILATPLSNPKDDLQHIRFNDAGVDPAGNYFVGSMSLPTISDGIKRGQLWRVDGKGNKEFIKEDVGCSNGIGWTEDGKTMCMSLLYSVYRRSFFKRGGVLIEDYVDSSIPQVTKYTMNSSGMPENPTKLTGTPPSAESFGSSPGSVFDGLCLDGVGNVWVARWKDEQVVGFRPDGSVICHIHCPGALNVTIPCFGGDNLETMYINTAHAKLGQGQQDKYSHSGDLYEVDFSQGSEIRKLLGEGWKGAEKYRFAG